MIKKHMCKICYMTSQLCQQVKNSKFPMGKQSRFGTMLRDEMSSQKRKMWPNISEARKGTCNATSTSAIVQIQPSNSWENMICPSEKQKKEKLGLQLWHNHFNILVHSVSLGLSRNPNGPGQQTEVPKQNTPFKSQHWCFLKIVWKISTAYLSIQPTSFFYFKFWVDEAWPDM